MVHKNGFEKIATLIYRKIQIKGSNGEYNYPHIIDYQYDCFYLLCTLMKYMKIK